MSEVNLERKGFRRAAHALIRNDMNTSWVQDRV